ncbi:hypothetical protein BDI4_1120022 [Burkholderia diffusa]|nr:hypothetical protein BDI4_1120022 [Burkholderia diffusa]
MKSSNKTCPKYFFIFSQGTIGQF